MATSIKESTRLERLMERAHILGEMEKSSMESGKQVKRKVMEFGVEYTATVTLVSGSTIKLKDMGYILGSMVIDTKENGKDASETVMEQTFFPMAMFTSANTSKENHKVRVNTSGQTETHTLESSLME